MKSPCPSEPFAYSWIQAGKRYCPSVYSHRERRAPSRKQKAPVHQGLLRIRGFRQAKDTARRCTLMENGAPPSRNKKPLSIRAFCAFVDSGRQNGLYVGRLRGERQVRRACQRGMSLGGDKRKAPVYQGLLRIRGFKQTKQTARRCTPVGNGAPSRKQKASVHQGLLRIRGFRQAKQTGRRRTPAGSSKPAGPANGACRLGDKRKAPVHQGLLHIRGFRQAKQTGRRQTP